MSTDSGSMIPPLPERSAAEQAARGGYVGPAAQSQPGQQQPQYPAAGQAQPGAYARPQTTATAEPAFVTQPQAEYAWAQPEQKQKKSKPGIGAKVAGLMVVAALIGGGVGLGGAWLGFSNFGNDSSTQQVTSSATGAQNVTINNPDDVNETAAIAAKALPSVVTIEAASDTASGSGSGVVLSEDGYVLTNTHVVTLGGEAANAQLRVTMSDGTIYDATVVGTDPTYDLAVIKLEGASGLTPVTFADSSKLNVGDTSVAIGAPMGLNNTVTTGVISNVNRSIEIASSAAPDDETTQQDDSSQQQSPWFFDLPGQDGQNGQGDNSTTTTSDSIKIAVLQTDAAINPGNSGGALLNSSGELIGINVAIATASSTSGESGSIGLGFAIPSNITERVSNEIIANGSATHGLLGASVAPAASVEGTTTTGAYIAEDPVSGGGAEAGGLQKGDIITKVDGVRVNDAIDLTAQIRANAAGTKVTITYVRDGSEHETEVTLGEM
ncbi:putative serine protease [Microbacterium sorbitolivorans]|uniref:PDZ domain-containing protein n=1 Tax=Microbacterium sorbitolivorans TaxID=1867410 RepID=A0A367Y8K6_9MICO|nr:trypsin-like peptidase domain-containing protein [Microbacterium sorbitolivorans]RCK61959.1 PDZ domain-containing protein [Microbacterium sorbitolivorans]GGF44312.1 putative serine protease [Microbacterium sorbitolivorans]